MHSAYGKGSKTRKALAPARQKRATLGHRPSGFSSFLEVPTFHDAPSLRGVAMDAVGSTGVAAIRGLRTDPPAIQVTDIIGKVIEEAQFGSAHAFQVEPGPRAHSFRWSPGGISDGG